VRLLELPYSFNVESVRRALIYQILNFVNILPSNPQFDATKQARPKPVHANQVLVSQKTFNATEIQNAFENDGLGQVPIPAQDDKFLLFIF
jgi:hypothetical protein